MKRNRKQHHKPNNYLKNLVFTAFASSLTLSYVTTIEAVTLPKNSVNPTFTTLSINRSQARVVGQVAVADFTVVASEATRESVEESTSQDEVTPVTEQETSVVQETSVSPVSEGAPTATATPASEPAPTPVTTPTQQEPAPATGYVSNLSPEDAAAKEWIAQKESGGSYTAQNGIFYGRYQLTNTYLNGDFSPENQERVADAYVAGRYGSWVAAKEFWLANHWY